MTTTPIDRLPPHSTEAESALLGCILLDPINAMAEAVSRGITTEAFYDLRNQVLFNVIRELVDSGSKPDLVMLTQRLKDLGALGEAGGISYVASLSDSTPSAANLPYYADIVKEKFLARKAIATCTEIIAGIFEDPDSVDSQLDKAEGAILGIRKITNLREAASMRELTQRVITNIEDRMAGKTGLETGFLDLDYRTSGGMNESEFWVVAARPNCGKTALAMNIADNVASKMLESWSRTAKPSAPYNGEHVLVFSLEMTAEALTERMVSSRARVNTRNYNQAEKRMTLVEGDLPKLANGTTVVSKLPIIIDDTAGLSIGAIRARARRYFHRNKVRLIIVDYLQLIASEPGIKSNERRVEVDSISRGLKQLAKELRIPVLALAQLNREIEKDGKGRKPRMSDLRESGQIEQDADFIGFLYPDPADDKDIQSPDAEIRSIFLRIAKQRNGPKDFDIPLVLFPHIVKFESAAKPSRYADAA